MANLYEEWRALSKGRPLKIAISGQGGYGKSTLINNFLGLSIREGAKAGKIGRAATKSVRAYEKEVRGIKVVIFDTPGLCDPRIPNDETLQDIGEVTGGEVDLLYYCVSLRIARFNDGDVMAFKLLSQLFGKALWENTVFVLTFANEECRNDGYPDLFKTLTEEFWFSLEKAGVSKREAQSITVVDAGDHSPRLIYCDNTENNWKEHLFIKSLKMAKPEAIPALLRIKMSDEEMEMILAPKKQEKREELGRAIGQAVGGGVGSFGGAVAGGVAGSVVGGLVGSAIGRGVGEWYVQKEVPKVETIVALKYQIWVKQRKRN